MSDDVPVLYPAAQELWQYSQAVVSVSSLVQRLLVRSRRVLDTHGRLAYSDDVHAARVAELWSAPAVRVMTADERAGWLARVPPEVAGRSAGSAAGVCCARMVDAAGEPTGAWGVEAHAWAGSADLGSESVFVVCRDASDAVALAGQLRRHGCSPEVVRQLRRLATDANRTVSAGRAPDGRPALSQQEWVDALRAVLPAAVADGVAVTGLDHPHRPAWLQLWALARDEVVRVGANPARLAEVVARVPRWHGPVRNPAALAHWALTQARAEPGYEQMVAGPAAVSPSRRTTKPVPTPLRRPERVTVHEVHGGEQARAWAAGLRRDEPADRIEAKVGFGRWGAAVDQQLARRFPDLITELRTAAEDHAVPADTDLPQRTAARREAPATVEALVGLVERMDPDRPLDQRAAHVMVGRVPVEVDRRLAARFGQDPEFARALAARYPNGLPEPEPTATGTAVVGDPASEPTSSRAGARETAAAAQRAHTAVPPAHHSARLGAGAGEAGLAERQRAAATATAAHTPTGAPTPPQHRRELPTATGDSPYRRTRRQDRR